jgi:hypothetical protein
LIVARAVLAPGLLQCSLQQTLRASWKPCMKAKFSLVEPDVTCRTQIFLCLPRNTGHTGHWSCSVLVVEDTSFSWQVIGIIDVQFDCFAVAT